MDLSRQHWIATHVLPYESQARRWLSRHARSLSASDTDDVIQEAYARIWDADLAKIRNPRAYFFQAVRNLLLEQARRAQIVPMERMGEIDALCIPSEEPGPEQRVGARQELERLQRLVTSLPAQCKRAFELRKIEGLSQREVAAEMGLSERTVERHLALALDRLALAAMDPERPVEGDAVAQRGMNGSRTQRD